MKLGLYDGISRDAARYNARVKVYGDVLQVTAWNRPTYNPDGWPDPRPPPGPRDPDAAPRADNLRRARQAVYDIAFLNTWTHFCTMTLDDDKCDRYDPDALRRHLHHWLGNRVSRDGLRYLLVPEHHKDGALHVHALIAADRLSLVDSGTVLCEGLRKPVKVATARRAGYRILKHVYNWPDWQLGFSTAIPVDGDPLAVAGYLAKYITKQSDKIFGKRYLAGGNIERHVETHYTDVNYEAFTGMEFEPVPGVKVKKRTIDTRKEDAKK